MRIMIELGEIGKSRRDDVLIGKLLSVWEASVRASHDFLTDEDITKIAPEARQALQFVDILVVVQEDGEPIGFMGVQECKIEMLFLAPAYFSHGIGRQLIGLALDKYNARYVDVNEQNHGAAKFYHRMGFKVIKRNELDGQGNPFPILEMEIDK